MCVGFPGVVLALLMTLFLKEPPRGLMDGGTNSNAAPRIIETAQTMWQNLALRHMIIGATITVMISYGLTQWLPTFFIRTQDMSAASVGMMMALFFRLLGLFGALISGKITDKLLVKGFQYGPWIISVSALLTPIFWVMAMFVNDFQTMMLLLIIPAFISNFYLGPTLALIQTMSPVHMRAVTAAITMLCLNLIGLGLGPLTVGILSDFLKTYYPETSLNMAIGCFSLFGFWASYHYYRCGKLLADGQQ